MSGKHIMAKTDIKKTFVTGLVALLPTILTVFVIVLAFNLLNNNVGMPIGRFLLFVFVKVGGSSVESVLHGLFGAGSEALALNPVFLTFIGLPIALVITFLVGLALASFIGRHLMAFLERVVVNLPVIKTIYPYAKQFADFVKPDAQKKQEFKRVVAVEYPRKGIYSIGFVTSDEFPLLQAKSGKRCVAVFVPSSPAPFTGFLIYVPEEETLDLGITVDEALPILISGGVLTPKKQ